MLYQYSDGGRSKYFKGSAGDCVVRALALASERDYREIYDALADIEASRRNTKGKKSSQGRTARNGNYTNTAAFKRYMTELGFEWESYARIGRPSRIKLDDSFPVDGVYVIKTGRHLACVRDGTLYDTYDSREGRAWIDESGVLHPPKPRMVYGVWKKVGVPS